MNIVEYEPKYRNSFVQFNTDWILDYFGRLEKEDVETFERIEEELKAGAMIYFAVEGDVVLATCMARPMDGATWEICKLASNKHREHKGCGCVVLEAAMQWAIEHGAKRLFIVSSRILKPALHIYEKYGSKEVRLKNYGYMRGDIAFERLID
ncbi:MAG: GNAT family N-acetyltransferase [Kiritimatiellia bacterium]